MTSFQKELPARDRRILQACRYIPCQHCGRDDGTVVAAHSNWFDLGGKGKARKADDRFVAALCFGCHMKLDQGAKLSKDQRRSMWLAAHTKTIDVLVRLKLWPKDLEMPQ